MLCAMAKNRYPLIDPCKDVGCRLRVHLVFLACVLTIPCIRSMRYILHPLWLRLWYPYGFGLYRYSYRLMSNAQIRSCSSHQMTNGRPRVNWIRYNLITWWVLSCPPIWISTNHVTESATKKFWIILHVTVLFFWTLYPYCTEPIQK